MIPMAGFPTKRVGLVMCMLPASACFYYEPIEDPVFNRLPFAVHPPIGEGDPDPEPSRPTFNGNRATLSIRARDMDDADIQFVWDEFAGLDYEEPSPPISFDFGDGLEWKSTIIIPDYTPVRGDILTAWLSDGHGDELTPVPWLMEPE